MRSILALFLFAAAASAAPPPLMFAPAAPNPGDAVMVTSTVPVTYDVRGAKATLHESKTAIFTMPPNGMVVVVASAGKTPAMPADTAVLAFGFASGPPLPPPTPVPSEETKALAATLTTAFSLEADADKAMLPALAKVWRDGISSVDSAKTWGDIEVALKDASTKAGLPNHLTFTRLKIANEMLKRVPGMADNASEIVLDDAGRASAKAAITLIADALSLVGK